MIYRYGAPEPSYNEPEPAYGAPEPAYGAPEEPAYAAPESTEYSAPAYSAPGEVLELSNLVVPVLVIVGNETSRITLSILAYYLLSMKPN